MGQVVEGARRVRAARGSGSRQVAARERMRAACSATNDVDAKNDESISAMPFVDR